jgi:plasmid stabilization system protein ParE
MAEYRLSPAAERDLQAIWKYTRVEWGLEHDPEPSFRALISLPESGRPSARSDAFHGRLDEIASDATSSHIGRAGQLLVARQTRLHGVELCAYRPERVAADQQVLRRLRHVHQSEDRRRSLVRIA